MKRSQGWLVALAALLALTGCRAPNGLESLQHELRHQEDYIYQLQDYINTYKSHLDSCRRENQSLRAEVAQPGAGSTVEQEAERQSDDIGMPPSDMSPEEIRPPSVDIGTEEVGPPNVEFPPSGPDDAQPLVPPGGDETNSLFPGLPLQPSTPSQPAEPGNLPAPDPSRPLFPSGDSSTSQTSGAQQQIASNATASGGIDKITLNRLLTGGYNIDGKPGDEGVLVVIEPRDAEDQIVPVAGKVSVALLNPTGATPLEARFARWHFEPHEVAKLFRTSPMGNGIHLEMLWPDRPPATADMRLYVRLITEDGSRLITDRPIRIDVPNTVAGQPAAPARSGASASTAPPAAPATTPTPTTMSPPPADLAPQRWASRPEGAIQPPIQNNTPTPIRATPAAELPPHSGPEINPTSAEEIAPATTRAAVQPAPSRQQPESPPAVRPPAAPAPAQSERGTAASWSPYRE